MLTTQSVAPDPADTHSAVIALSKRVVAENDPALQQDLYCLVGRGMRLLIARKIGEQKADHAVQEALASVIVELRSGSLTPDGVFAGIRCAVQLAIHKNKEDRASANLSSRAIQNPSGGSVLQLLSVRDREILIRVYVRGESHELLGLNRVELNNIQNRVRTLLRKSARSSPLLNVLQIAS